MTERVQLSPEEAIRRVEHWQRAHFVQPLKCSGRAYTCSEALRGEVQDGQPVLVCPSCGYVQRWIPDYVLAVNLEAIQPSSQ